MNLRNFLPGTWFQQRNSDQRTPTKTRIVFPHHKYHARTNAVSTETRIVFPHHNYHARTNAVSTRTRIVFPHHKYVADQQPTDRQFRYSNRPIRCSTQLNRYYGHYHEHPPLGLLYLPDQKHIPGITKNKLRLGLQLLISSQGQSHGELQKDLSAEPS